MLNPPVNPDIWIVPANATIRFRRVIIVRFIKKFNMIGESDEPMSKSTGNKKLFLIPFRKFHANPLFISRTVRPQIYCHIKHCATYTSYKFSLGFISFLEMNATQGSFYGTHGVIVLHKIIKKPCFFHNTPAPTFHEKTAMIAEDFRDQHIYAFQFCF